MHFLHIGVCLLACQIYIINNVQDAGKVSCSNVLLTSPYFKLIIIHVIIISVGT